MQVLTGSSFLQNAPGLEAILGSVYEIQPAAGEYWASFWMDGLGMQFSFYVIGEKGEGVVLMRRYECFDADLIFRGQLRALFHGIGC
jgi:hypothetical protein